MTKKEQALEAFVRDCWWMARRYAEGRMTYAPSLFNERLAEVRKHVDLRPDQTCDDGYSAKGHEIEGHTP